MIFDKIEDWFRQRNEEFKKYLQNLCPPGYELAKEYRFFWCWLICGILYSMQFLIRYVNAYEDLFYYSGSTKTRVLNLNMLMPGFWTLLGGSFDIFLLGILFLIFVFWMHYDYYRRESKSIYLMKRLEKRGFLRKTYVGTPCIYGVLFLGTGVVLLAVYYLIYRFVTPQMCLKL